MTKIEELELELEMAKLKLEMAKLEEKIRYNKSIERLFNEGLLTREDISLFVEIVLDSAKIDGTAYRSSFTINVQELMKRSLSDFLAEYSNIIYKNLFHFNYVSNEKMDFWRRLSM